MPKYEPRDVDYGEFRYKGYEWSEYGRREKERPKRRKQTSANENMSGGVFATIAIVLCFVVTFLCAEYVSNGSLISMFNGGRRGGKIYYAVAADCYDDDGTARIYADELRRLGGGGYLICDDGYYLIAAVYGKKNDAEKVVGNMNGKSASIYEISIDEPSLAWCSDGDRNKVENALACADTVYKSLYEISVNLDGGTVGEKRARNEIAALGDSIGVLTDDFGKFADYAKSKNTLDILVWLKSVEAMLENLADADSARYNLLSDVRYTYTAVLMSYKYLCSGI